MIENILKTLGLSDKEVKVYLSCLKAGPSSVRKIAEIADINRGTTYDILKSLIEQGLISYYHKDKKQYFIAEDPEKLKDTLDRKKQELEKTKKSVDQIIPELKSIYNKAGAKPVAKFYDGYSGIKLILQDVISSSNEIAEKEYYVFSSSAIKDYLYNVYPEFSDDRIKKGIKVKVISIGPGGETRGLDERKWLTKKESAPTYIIIYSDKLAMISVDDNQKPIGVIIEDKNIYQTQKMTFEFIWGKL
ncbi:MAG: transcriptional regulator [Parcubacteria group bacterium]|nr:transcriptional regulator [Parcubacteria group bacterium]|tara:strand:+ start:4816 stop:5553 length:738 start_codon:yes stop_codon:yes gene_type:complete